MRTETGDSVRVDGIKMYCSYLAATRAPPRRAKSIEQRIVRYLREKDRGVGREEGRKRFGPFRGWAGRRIEAVVMSCLDHQHEIHLRKAIA